MHYVIHNVSALSTALGRRRGNFFRFLVQRARFTSLNDVKRARSTINFIYILLDR